MYKIIGNTFYKCKKKMREIKTHPFFLFYSFCNIDYPVLKKVKKKIKQKCFKTGKKIEKKVKIYFIFFKSNAWFVDNGVPQVLYH